VNFKQPTFKPDSPTLGFAAAFVALGIAGLLQACGLDLHAAPLYPLILISLGGVGLWTVLKRRPRSS
jgi:hypothetical protein